MNIRFHGDISYPHGETSIRIIQALRNRLGYSRQINIFPFTHCNGAEVFISPTTTIFRYYEDSDRTVDQFADYIAHHLKVCGL